MILDVCNTQLKIENWKIFTFVKLLYYRQKD